MLFSRNRILKMYTHILLENKRLPIHKYEHFNSMTSILLFIVCDWIYINKLKFYIDLVILLYFILTVLLAALSNVFVLRLCCIDWN